jgi:hypothetical protein
MDYVKRSIDSERYVHDWHQKPYAKKPSDWTPKPKIDPTERIFKELETTPVVMPDNVIQYTSRARKLYRLCGTCHKPVYVRKAYRIITKEKDEFGIRLIDSVYCSEPCYQVYIDKVERKTIRREGIGYYDLLRKRAQEATLAELCAIVKRHDDELKEDPERLDIGKYIETYVPCLHDKKKPKPDEPDYTVTSGFRQSFI